MTTDEKVCDRLSVGGYDACWEWQGATTDAGYGTVDDGGRTRLVHRFMWVKFYGAIPADRQIDHLCRNRRCGNPHHMELVTSRENTLRGTGPTAQNALKTRCKNGHEFTPENTYMSKKGRECRTCKRELSRRWMAARRVLAHEEEVTPNVVHLPICSECAKGNHIYCLDDGSSTVTCRCPCGDESRPVAHEEEA